MNGEDQRPLPPEIGNQDYGLLRISKADKRTGTHAPDPNTVVVEGEVISATGGESRNSAPRTFKPRRFRTISPWIVAPASVIGSCIGFMYAASLLVVNRPSPVMPQNMQIEHMKFRMLGVVADPERNAAEVLNDNHVFEFPYYGEPEEDAVVTMYATRRLYEELRSNPQDVHDWVDIYVDRQIELKRMKDEPIEDLEQVRALGHAYVDRYTDRCSNDDTDDSCYSVEELAGNLKNYGVYEGIVKNVRRALEASK